MRNRILKYFSAKSKNGQKSYNDLVNAARQARDAGNVNQELELWNTTRKMYPNYTLPAIAYIQAYRRLHGTQQTIPLVEEVIKQFPKHPAPYKEQFKNLHKTNLPKAFEYLDRVVQFGEVDDKLAQLYTRTVIKLRTWDVMSAPLGKWEKEFPDNIRLQADIALLYVYSGEVQKGIQRIIDTLKNHPSSKEIETALGFVAINEIMKSTMELDEVNKPTPILENYRYQFFHNPSEALETWRNNALYPKLEYSRQHNKRKENSGTVNHILFVSHYNWNFMQGIIETFDTYSDIQIKTMEFQDIPKVDRFPVHTVVGSAILHGMQKESITPYISENTRFQSVLKWADTIFIEWVNYPAVWLSWFGPRDKKIILRLHSYEAFTYWSHLVNWGNIYKVIFVADHIKKFLNRQIDLNAYGVHQEVIPNYNNLAKYQLPKKGNFQKTIGLIGFNTSNKNPILALKILKKLRDSDPEWKLLLVGHNWVDEESQNHECSYYKEFTQYIQSNHLESSIEYYGFTDMLEEAIQFMGYILSTSEREGTHESVIQSMASGSIPIVRMWPILKEFGSAANIYSDKWIYESPEQAVTMIHHFEQDFNKYSQMAIDESMRCFDASVVVPKLREALTD